MRRCLNVLHLHLASKERWFDWKTSTGTQRGVKLAAVHQSGQQIRPQLPGLYGYGVREVRFRLLRGAPGWPALYGTAAARSSDTGHGPSLPDTSRPAAEPGAQEPRRAPTGFLNAAWWRSNPNKQKPGVFNPAGLGALDPLRSLPGPPGEDGHRATGSSLARPPTDYPAMPDGSISTLPAWATRCPRGRPDINRGHGAPLAPCAFRVDGFDYWTHSGRWNHEYVQGPEFGRFQITFEQPGPHAVEIVDAVPADMETPAGYGVEPAPGPVHGPPPQPATAQRRQESSIFREWGRRRPRAQTAR